MSYIYLHQSPFIPNHQKMSTQSHLPKIYFQIFPLTNEKCPPNHTHPKYTFNQLHLPMKCIRRYQRKKSLHLESILQSVANLTQNHCSPWKKSNLIGPKNDSSANRNVEMQTLISDTHIFIMKIKNQLFGSKSNRNFHINLHTYTQRHTYKHTNIYALVVEPSLMQSI